MNQFGVICIGFSIEIHGKTSTLILDGFGTYVAFGMVFEVKAFFDFFCIFGGYCTLSLFEFGITLANEFNIVNDVFKAINQNP